MVPSVADIIRYRYVTRLVLRLIGLGLLIFSLVPILSWFVEGFLDWDLLYFTYYFTRICSGSIMLIVGLGLIVLAGPLAKLFNPFPRNECPQCGYQLRQLTRPACPECGLQLPEQLLVDERQPPFMTNPTPPTPPTQPTPPGPPGA